MKVIIAGGRDFNDAAALNVAIARAEKQGIRITEVVSGRARGADALGETWARAHGIPIKPFPADWNRFGNAAGPRRNTDMADYAEALIALPGGRGTRDMIAKARSRGLLVHIHNLRVSEPGLAPVASDEGARNVQPRLARADQQIGLGLMRGL